MPSKVVVGRTGSSGRESARVLGTPEPVLLERTTMSTQEPTTQEGTVAELTDFDARPQACTCAPTFDELPCWPCYRAGFEEPNPNVDEE